MIFLFTRFEDISTAQFKLKTNLPNIKSSLSAYISLEKTSIIFQTGLSGLKNRFDKRRRTWRERAWQHPAVSLVDEGKAMG